METFRELWDRIRVPVEPTRGDSSWPPGYSPKRRLTIPSQRALTLPVDPRRGGTKLLESGVAPHPSANPILVCSPGLITPLRQPTSEELALLGIDTQGFRNENPRSLGLAVIVRNHDCLDYGVGRMVVIENALRMGSASIASFDSQWVKDFDDAQLLIVDHIMAAHPSVLPEREPSGKPWRKVVALLGGTSGGPLPEGWQRIMKIAAGMRQVVLDIRVNPDSSRRKVVQQLRSEPPDGLLVWANWVKDVDTYILPYVHARPGAYAQALGVGGATEDFGNHIEEMMLHLTEIAPLEEEVKSPHSSDAISWPDAKAKIEELEGDHLILTSRARAMLEGNPYPVPVRMLEHMEKLSRIARAYHINEGVLDSRFEDFALRNEGLSIALFDSTLTDSTIQYEGRVLSTVPHVKVDDYKRPDRCGRIYFALDREPYRLVVDHIGLHNYG